MEVQVLPYSAGAHAGIDGPIEIMSFPDAPDAAHADGRGGGSLIDRPEEVAEVRRAFDRVVAAALSAEETSEMIARAVESIT